MQLSNSTHILQTNQYSAPLRNYVLQDCNRIEPTNLHVLNCGRLDGVGHHCGTTTQLHDDGTALRWKSCDENEYHSGELWPTIRWDRCSKTIEAGALMRDLHHACIRCIMHRCVGRLCDPRRHACKTTVTCKSPWTRVVNGSSCTSIHAPICPLASRSLLLTIRSGTMDEYKTSIFQSV